MNVLYRMPQEVNSYKQVDEFYNARRYIMLFYDIMGWQDKTCDEFLKRVTDPQLQRYFNIGGFEGEEEFKKNLPTGTAEYKKDTTAGYEAFWNYEGNHAVLAKFKRPNNSLFELSKIEAFLRKHQSGSSYERILLLQPNQTPSTLEDSIKICEEEANVAIKPVRSIFGLFGLQCFSIHDNTPTVFEYKKTIGGCLKQLPQPVGYFYYKNSPRPMTIPLGNRISLVKAPATHQTTHEIIHAVQNYFTPFYNYPKELVEIPAMAIERRFINNDTTPANSTKVVYKKPAQNYIDRNIAIALADIAADNPETFDRVFNAESKSTPPVKMVSRFWHYIHYPRQYYAYVLGLLIPVKTGDIAKWVRNPDQCKNDVENLLKS